MKVIKLNIANKLINKKFVIEKSNEKIFIGIRDKIWNCSKGACNMFLFYVKILNLSLLNNDIVLMEQLKQQWA